MDNPTPATKAHLRSLKWQNQCGFEAAWDERCFYMRETAFSMVAGLFFGTVMSVGLGICGVFMMMEKGNDGKFAGAFVLLLGLFFGFLMVISLKPGRWLITYDRGTGEPGSVGEIRFRKLRISADRVRCITTQSSGGNPPKRTVSAEMHDGTYQSLGPVGSSTWPAHWAKQAADWMGLPYRDSLS